MPSNPDVLALFRLEYPSRAGTEIEPAELSYPARCYDQLGTARPKPAINFRSLRGIARQAITTATNNNNFAAARLTSST